MTPIVEIKPSPDRDGFCLHFGKTDPVWFAHEHHAVGHAQEAYLSCEVVVYHGVGIIKRRYAPMKPEERPSSLLTCDLRL